MLPLDLSLLAEQAPRTTVYHSEDDPIVPFSHMKRYGKALPKATLVALKGRAHIWQEGFPEIVDAIRSLP